MQVKKFIGENTAQVMAMIRRDFGEDAIILQTNKIKTGGFLGFFQKEAVEILAILDNDAIRKSRLEKYQKIAEDEKDTRKLNESLKATDFKSHLQTLNEEAKKREKTYETKDKQDIKQYSSIEDEKVKVDLDEIKNTVNQLSMKINQTFKTPEEEEDEKKAREKINSLVSSGISYELSKELITNLKKSGKIDSYDDLEREILDRFLPYFENQEKNDSKYMMFIGSTGVGKTTTLAKVASKVAIEEHKKIGFLTLDTYRISAVEQLKTYAEILASPIEVAYEVKDMSTAIDRLSNRDYVYIDTAGRSHNNKAQVEDVRMVLENIKEKDVYLVISANMNINDIYDIIDAYSFIDDYKIIVTKLDETKRLGNLLNIMIKSEKPISYVTFGQNVPDDIEKFDLRTFVRELLKEIENDK